MRNPAAVITAFAMAWGLSCGGAATPPASAPVAGVPASAAASTPAPNGAASPSGASSDPWALPPSVAGEGLRATPGALDLAVWRRASVAKGVPPSSGACAAFVTRAPARPAPTDLRAAVGEVDAAKRDAALAALEREHDGGAIRALRADLAPIDCADALVDPILSTRAKVEGDVGHVLVGLSLAGKLARTAKAPPQLPGGGEKAKVAEFVKGPLTRWVVAQATAIETLASGAAGLVGYGRGIAAIEAGNADLRLVDNIRSAPVPKEWDAELRQIYEVSLDEALEPRKTRGRDAALVGLAELAEIGSLHDARVERARSMLSKLYGGRRIDALDALLAPPLGASGDPSVPDFWLAAASLAYKSKTSTSYAARRALEEGRTYWRRARFVDAAYAAKDGPGEGDRLILALALALAHGPRSAAEMMRAPSPAALDLAHTEALDALAAEGGSSAGMAAYDAALLRWLCPPEGDAAGPYLADVAARFQKAASLLADAAQKKNAADHAADAAAAAAAVAARRGDDARKP